MIPKEIIIRLIIEDMRYHQFQMALINAGMDAFNLELDLMGIVANLMGIASEDISDEWLALYYSELQKCESLPVEPLGKNLYALAEACYTSLKDFSRSSDSHGF